MSGSHDPKVSVCIPVFDAEGWIERAVRSALEQTYGNLEVVIVDNASTDATVDRVREIDDPRIRLYANSHNLGVYRNFNRAIGLARGRYIKFLCADDALDPGCVEAMLRVFELDPRVGLCFSPRDIELAAPTDPAAARWKAKHERAHLNFGALGEVNSGDALLEAWVAAGLRDNWIGEPTNVMISRECLRRTGTFPLRMHNKGDMDLWIRAMLSHSVGFVDRPLAGYLVHAQSLAMEHRASYRHWLDTVWMLEGLLSFPEARRRYPALRRLRRRALARSTRNALRGTQAPEHGKLAGLARYARFRLRGRRDRPRLWGTADDAGSPGETVSLSEAARPATRGAAALGSGDRARSGSGSAS